jgi:hypothetical protein
MLVKQEKNIVFFLKPLEHLNNLIHKLIFTMHIIYLSIVTLYPNKLYKKPTMGLGSREQNCLYLFHLLGNKTSTRNPPNTLDLPK